METVETSEVMAVSLEAAQRVHLLDRWLAATEATAVLYKLNGVSEATRTLEAVWHAVFCLHLLDGAMVLMEAAAVPLTVVRYVVIGGNRGHVRAPRGGRRRYEMQQQDRARGVLT